MQSPHLALCDHPPGSTGAVLRALFDQVLRPVLCRPVSTIDMMSTDGSLTIWLPEVRMAVLAHRIPAAVPHEVRVRIAKAETIDILAIDCTRPGPVECEVDLFSPAWTDYRTIERVRLWLSPLGQPYLVPSSLPGRMPDAAQSIGFSQEGLSVEGNPFDGQEAWCAGHRRATAVMAAIVTDLEACVIVGGMS